MPRDSKLWLQLVIGALKWLGGFQPLFKETVFKFSTGFHLFVSGQPSTAGL